MCEGLDRASLAYGMFLATCAWGAIGWIWYEYVPRKADRDRLPDRWKPQKER